MASEGLALASRPRQISSAKRQPPPPTSTPDLYVDLIFEIIFQLQRWVREIQSFT